MAVDDMAITAKREEVVDFSIPFMHLGLTASILKPLYAIESIFYLGRSLISKQNLLRCILMWLFYSFLKGNIVFFCIISYINEM